MQTTRREFIKASAGWVLAMSVGHSTSLAAGKRIPIAFQLYTVRGEFSRDVPGTLKKLAEIGYKAVEFWGYAGTPNVYQNYSAADLRKMLDENGLKCCGIHLELKALEPANFNQTVENSRTLGNEYLNIAMAKDKMSSEKGIGELADFLNETAVKCRSHKMTVGYHSHGFDFAKINGHFAWELLFKRTQPEVNMQLDVGNSLDGDGDPIAMLKEFPGRSRTVHIKEHKDKTFDSEFYKEVFHLCGTVQGTKWYIVEMGGPSGDGFDVPEAAFAKLKGLGKA